jgi:hypothetical protein
MALVFGVALAAGCGSDNSGLGRTDPGTGTGTLFVDARVDYDNLEAIAGLRVDVRKGGRPLNGAHVQITSETGPIDLTAGGDGEYRGAYPGWSSSGYILSVTVFGPDGKTTTDALEASLQAPVRVDLASPDVTRPFDARTLPNGVLVVAWQGPAADRVEVRSGDFDPAPFTPDPLSVSIPAAMLRNDLQKLEIRREASVALAGGLPGSTFTAHYRLRTSLIVQNPY